MAMFVTELPKFKYGGPESHNLVRLFVGNAVPLHQLGDGKLGIGTLEGVMEATPGDWIIRGIKGEFYPCKPDIFEMTYEKVEEAKLYDAIKFCGSNGQEVAKFLGCQYPAIENGCLMVGLPGRVGKAKVGDWVVKRVDGSFDVFTPEEFAIAVNKEQPV